MEITKTFGEDDALDYLITIGNSKSWTSIHSSIVPINVLLKLYKQDKIDLTLEPNQPYKFKLSKEVMINHYQKLIDELEKDE